MRKKMKSTIMITVTLVLVFLFGCQISPQGGSDDVGFKIAVPNFTTQIKQGELQTIAVSLRRDALFRLDVDLQVKAPTGISIDPLNFTIKASDQPNVQLKVIAHRDAPLGEYPVVLKGTPTTGVSTSVGFTIKVIYP
jgi:uncharacterized membrane protein